LRSAEEREGGSIRNPEKTDSDSRDSPLSKESSSPPDETLTAESILQNTFVQAFFVFLPVGKGGPRVVRFEALVPVPQVLVPRSPGFKCRENAL